MKTFLVLFRLQFSTLLRFFAVKGKKGASKAVTVTSGVVLLAVCFISVFVSIGALFWGFADAILGFWELSWLYMTLAFLLTTVLMFVGTIFLAKAQLFEAKDNTLLLTMPIPPRLILLSRMLSLFLMNLIFGSSVILPALIFYFWNRGFSISVLLVSLLLFLSLALFSLALSCLLGWIISVLFARIKSKTFVTVLFSLVFIAAYYYFIGQGPSKLMIALYENSALVAETLGAFLPLYWIGSAAAEINPTHILCSLGILLLPFILVYVLLSVTFLRTITTQHGFKKTLYRAGIQKRTPVSKALYRRENARLLSSATYLLNAGIGSLFLLVSAGYLIYLYVNDTLSVLFQFLGKEYLGPILCAGICLLLSTALFAAPSVALDAKTLWILRTMPVPSKQILLAKWKLHLLWTCIPALVPSCIAAVLFLRDDPLWFAIVILLPQLYAVFSGGLGMFFGIRFANMEWTNEVQAIKQSLAVLLSMFGSMAILGVFILTVYLLRNLCAVWIPVLGIILLLAAGCCMLYRWITTKGCTIFESFLS